MNELGNIKVYFILYIRFFKIEYDIDNIPKKIYKDILIMYEKTIKTFRRCGDYDYDKKKEEVEKIGKQLFIYNNPSNTFILLIIFNFLDININNISNITYNSIVKYIFTNHAGKDKDN